jgi:glycosyltransferase involved in cell wall biosynthesis
MLSNKYVMRKKKIAIIGTAGVPAKYGGFETLAHNLVKELNQEFEIHVYASKKVYSKQERPKYWNGARVHYLGISPNGLSSIFYDFFSMIHASFITKTFLVLGVSGGLFFPLFKVLARKKIIINIDGLEWRRDKWSKPIKQFLKLSEKVAVRFSNADITDNLSIKRYTSRQYKSVSHLIAYGADHVLRREITEEDLVKFPFLDRHYAFKVARIEPENNIEMILKAFAYMPNEPLILVGNWQSSEFGKRMILMYKKFKNLSLLDPIYNQEKLDLLRSNCTFYIHGHSAGGTNPSLVEAMFLELPVFSFDVSFNRATTNNKAIFFKDEVDLKNRIQNTNLIELNQTARDLKEIANKEYTWRKIASRYASIVKSFDYAYRKPQYSSKMTKASYTQLLTSGRAHLQNVRPIFNDLQA